MRRRTRPRRTFFFSSRRRHTRLVSDWSSDVCSSDLERAHAPRVGYLDVPGGFLEAGESIEGGARRELLEETGLGLGRVAWLGFYWDTYFLRGFGRFPVMNFYFVGRWRRGEPRAADDAATATWFPLASLGGHARRFAWAHM